MNQMVAEVPWLWAGLAAYAMATFIAMWGAVPKPAIDMARSSTKRTIEMTVLVLLIAGVLLLTMALAQRWIRIGHGPFVNMFELLISQLWSLGLFFVVIYWRAVKLRDAAVVVLPLMWVLGSWVLLLEPEASVLPATYYNDWKWAHVLLGKVFLASCLVATGLAGVMLLRRNTRLRPLFSAMPPDEVLDRIAWRFMMLALIFDSLMLIAGAVWAQDAWGRYWDWDDLETSSFLNWLALGISLHIRLSYRVPVVVSSLMVIGIFAFAFFTYFGVPYISPAPHKGVI